ncbi:hypothetical protein KIN20_036964 [Parelaphostrongylus tenuis]|uniref:Uncharacterized protein n=1 Tax=Parelaphostrongylus tenuis TaxID=148309 RepID=A0AAD5WKY7_PARTN|nr:hypothetical protein KIN20_036964 [Parelaphostrongylus tenuis]
MKLAFDSRGSLGNVGAIVGLLLENVVSYFGINLAALFTYNTVFRYIRDRK